MYRVHGHCGIKTPDNLHFDYTIMPCIVAHEFSFSVFLIELLDLIIQHYENFKSNDNLAYSSILIDRLID